MKKLLYIIIILLFVSCIDQTKQKIHYINDGVNIQQETKQSFTEFYFKIECPCELKQEFVNEKDNYYAFRCNSTDKETIYAISVKNLKEDLRKYNNHSSKEYYKNSFFEEYETNLKTNKIEYEKPIIYGFDAIEYSIPINNILNKQVIFIIGNLAYTLSVTSSADKIDGLFNAFSNSFELFHRSPKYLYSIEIPKGFSQMEIIGKNVDLKYGDEKGNSIIVIVKKLLPQEQAMTANDLLNIPNSYWETNLQLPNVKIKKKGKVSVDYQDGMFLHYTSKHDSESYTLYYTNYLFIFNGYQYCLTATCEDTDLAKMQPIFFRALQSFTFPK